MTLETLESRKIPVAADAARLATPRLGGRGYRHWAPILCLLGLLLTAGCSDDCVVVYRFDQQSGLWLASGCGTVTLFTPTPTPTPR